MPFRQFDENSMVALGQADGNPWPLPVPSWCWHLHDLASISIILLYSTSLGLAA